MSNPGIGVFESTEGDSPDGGPTPLSLWLDQVRSAEPKEVIEALRGRAWDEDRYVVKDEIDRGGMGIIYRVWDAQLRRHLAMKVLREDLGERPDLLVRFLDEAQITGQLEHPGVVPVHDFGLDARGRFYFTMMWVRGRDFNAVIKDVVADRRGWTLARALGVMLRVSETMAYAHDRQVVHRDLKPANIMVGPFGETFVMDWGLARVLSGPPLATSAAGDVTHPHVWTDRGEARWRRPDAAMVSRVGQVLGTPAYMAPEQARAHGDLPGPHMDVYATGATLYHLLAGHRPYADRDPDASGAQVREWLLAGPPTPLDSARRRLPPELIAICGRAMARRPAERYASMEHMVGDLRAFLEGRVVKAHRTGAWIEFRKWVSRNRAVASLAAAILVVVLASMATVTTAERRRLSAARESLDEYTAAAIVAEADELWPIDERTIPRIDRWLEQAEDLCSRGPRYRRELETLRARGAAAPDPAVDAEAIARAQRLGQAEQWLDIYRSMLDRITARLSEAATPPRVALDRDRAILQREVRRREVEVAALRREHEHFTPWSLPQRGSRERFERLRALVWNLDRLQREEDGLLQRIRARRESSRTLRRRTVIDEASAWTQAVESIADRQRCPLYEGLVIEPRVGLVPLGCNEGGLWEFWHVPSGARPALAADGRWTIEPETGLVFVLLPGGTTRLGAQRDDAGAPCYEPAADRSEQPPRSVELDPFFISRYEMTQEQWYRLAGHNPSQVFPGMDTLVDDRISSTHPVEMVSWNECVEILGRLDLELPTEAQWEYAARGGVLRGFWGDERERARAANFLDRTALQLSPTERRGETPSVEDGYGHHAPVDAREFPANPYGLEHVLGNVREWTRDWYAEDYSDRHVMDLRSGDGELVTVALWKSMRGGGFEDPLADMRVTRRYTAPADFRDEDTGLRPILRLDRRMSAD